MYVIAKLENKDKQKKKKAIILIEKVNIMKQKYLKNEMK